MFRLSHRGCCHTRVNIPIKKRSLSIFVKHGTFLRRIVPVLMQQPNHIAAKTVVTSVPYHLVRSWLASRDNLFSNFAFQGHTQQEHETSHGSMTETRWAVDGPGDASLELGGHRFSANDEGAPMMCNLVCSSMGRHVHIDYCRADGNGPCDAAEVQHISDRIVPEPDKPKDAVTHSLYWQRMGSSAPYLSRLILS